MCGTVPGVVPTRSCIPFQGHRETEKVVHRAVARRDLAHLTPVITNGMKCVGLALLTIFRGRPYDSPVAGKG